jgi:hypothetical protein
MRNEPAINLSLKVGLVFWSLFVMLYLYLLGTYYFGAPRDQLTFAAIVGAPASVFACRVVHQVCALHTPSSVLIQWAMVFIAGGVQWFFGPAVICWLLFDPSRRL